MSIAAILASALVVQAPAPGEGAVEVAYPEMVAGRTSAAIDKIEHADARDAAHPARLINLGIAYARMGEDEKARKLLSDAAACNERYWLETASGEWADAREVALKAIAKLDRGEFAGAQFASR